MVEGEDCVTKTGSSAVHTSLAGGLMRGTDFFIIIFYFFFLGGDSPLISEMTSLFRLVPLCFM